MLKTVDTRQLIDRQTNWHNNITVLLWWLFTKLLHFSWVNFHHHTCFISRLARSAEMEGKYSQDLNCWTLFPVPVCGCSLVSFSSASAFALKYLSFIKKDLKWLIWKTDCFHVETFKRFHNAWSSWELKCEVFPYLYNPKGIYRDC